VKLGAHQYPIGACQQLGELRDSSDVRGQPDVLRSRLQEDGYVFLRGVIPKEDVARARGEVLGVLDEDGLLDKGHPKEEGVVAGDHDGDQGMIKGLAESGIIYRPSFQCATNNDALFDFFAKFFGEEVTTFDYKWVRAVKPGESSGFHMDSVYMARGSRDLVTCWIPLMEVPWEMGGLAVVPGSNHLENYKTMRETYGELDLDKDDVGGTGWFSADPEEVLKYGSRFETAHFMPGDIVFFTLKTVHGSAVNQSNRWRMSVDVRFQPASHPIDERWFKDPKDQEIKGLKSRWSLHRNDPAIFPKTMQDAKKEWGLV